MGLLLMGFAFGVEPKIAMFAQPWVSFGHLLRSTVWMQFVLGVVNLLPAAALPSRQLLRSRSSRPAATVVSAGPGFGLGAATAVGVLLAGFLLMSVWLIVLGGFLLLYAQVRAGAPLDVLETGAIFVGDVMLTEYTLLSSSDTLSGALAQTAHSLQDVFPVVRGDRLVGAISRSTLANRLQLEGDGYLQSLMTKNLPLASPGEKLVEALRRGSALGASDFIPVVEDGAMLGILTPQSLARAVQQVRLTRPPQADRNQS
jgi:CBS domain-containing protein